MNTKAFFPCGGVSNLILVIGPENQLFFSENLSHCQVFSTNCQKMTLWHHWGASWECWMPPPMMPLMMGAGNGCPCDGGW